MTRAVATALAAAVVLIGIGAALVLSAMAFVAVQP